jgi:hypothetical protein
MKSKRCKIHKCYNKTKKMLGGVVKKTDNWLIQSVNDCCKYFWLNDEQWDANITNTEKITSISGTIKPANREFKYGAGAIIDTQSFTNDRGTVVSGLWYVENKFNPYDLGITKKSKHWSQAGSRQTKFGNVLDHTRKHIHFFENTRTVKTMVDDRNHDIAIAGYPNGSQNQIMNISTIFKGNRQLQLASQQHQISRIYQSNLTAIDAWISAGLNPIFANCIKQKMKEHCDSCYRLNNINVVNTPIETHKTFDLNTKISNLIINDFTKKYNDVIDITSPEPIIARSIRINELCRSFTTREEIQIKHLFKLIYSMIFLLNTPITDSNFNIFTHFLTANKKSFKLTKDNMYNLELLQFIFYYSINILCIINGINLPEYIKEIITCFIDNTVIRSTAAAGGGLGGGVATPETPKTTYFEYFNDNNHDLNNNNLTSIVNTFVQETEQLQSAEAEAAKAAAVVQSAAASAVASAKAASAKAASVASVKDLQSIPENNEDIRKEIKKYNKKMKDIEKLEEKLETKLELNQEERTKINQKSIIIDYISRLEAAL